MPDAVDRKDAQSGAQAMRHVDLVAKVQQDAAAFGPGRIAVGKAPVLPPLPHVMADLQIEAIGVDPGLDLRQKGWMIPHHQAHHRTARDRGSDIEYLIERFQPISQRLFHVKRHVQRGAERNQFQAHLRRRRDHDSRLAHGFQTSGKFGQIDLAPGQQMGLCTKRLEIGMMPPPDGPCPDDEILMPHGVQSLR